MSPGCTRLLAARLADSEAAALQLDPAVHRLLPGAALEPLAGLEGGADMAAVHKHYHVTPAELTGGMTLEGAIATRVAVRD